MGNAGRIDTDGIHKREYTKQQEQQGSNKQGDLPLEDSGKILKGDGYSTLLGIKERDNLLQDSAMHVSGKRPQGLNLWVIEDRIRGRAYKNWRSLRSPNKI